MPLLIGGVVSTLWGLLVLVAGAGELIGVASLRDAPGLVIGVVALVLLARTPGWQVAVLGRQLCFGAVLGRGGVRLVNARGAGQARDVLSQVIRAVEPELDRTTGKAVASGSASGAASDSSGARALTRNR